jgi:hypothetical protein
VPCGLWVEPAPSLACLHTINRVLRHAVSTRKICHWHLAADFANLAHGTLGQNMHRVPLATVAATMGDSWAICCSDASTYGISR